MRETIAQALKDALKAQDKLRISTLRLVNAAIQDRDISNRGVGKDPVSDEDILQILAKMVKQREESAKAFEDGKRPELAEKERAEIEVIRGFLPKQMDEAAVKQAVADAIAETGAEGLRDMGRVMAVLKERFTGQMDFGKAGALVKASLQ
ncbi:GatB/YqeY domain-containing protein [Pseudaminobacter soli (ex Li et al. 2025)]|jgi:uncharacterized protein|uniref:Glutamyl-tRNA amidotransferase n=1 Tax=Pseudaminobacter soli (ex Li et al. 2025) TaxID=1295366 RepID=A0A2P7S723_9HYPH|nr:GatB/YqeY domain-containing protein [Mesorhizobium soli]PSJ58276.1 glutamyl-tRNA amidotransferase [Mesorhizobium soli]